MRAVRSDPLRSGSSSADTAHALRYIPWHAAWLPNQAEDVQPVTELRKSVPPHVAAATGKSLEKLAVLLLLPHEVPGLAEFGPVGFGTSSDLHMSILSRF